MKTVSPLLMTFTASSALTARGFHELSIRGILRSLVRVAARKACVS